MQVLLSAISCLDSPDFGAEGDACIIKVINNGALPHSRLHDCLLEGHAINRMFSILLRAPPAVHDKVLIIVLTFLHRFASLCKQAREAIIADEETFIMACRVLKSVVRSICGAEEAGTATSEQLGAGLEALKLMYAVLFVGPVSSGTCSEALSDALSCVGSLFLPSSRDDSALLPLEEQFVNLCLVSTDAVFEHMDPRLISSFSSLLLNQMSRHDRTDVANPANIKLISSIHVAMRLASHAAGLAPLHSVVVPATADEVPPHIFACMQSFDLRVKDSIQELAWILCGCDGATVLRHYGMGLAAGLLQAKGLIEVPEASTS
jgi:hypothetical protein